MNENRSARLFAEKSLFSHLLLKTMKSPFGGAKLCGDARGK